MAESEHTHALVVETVWLCEVDDVEADLLVLLGVGYPKEVPLRVTVGVDIILKDQVVLVERQLYCDHQIARFKPRLKNERRVIRRFGDVILTRRHDHVADFSLCFQFGKIFVVTFYVVLLHQLFDVDEVGRDLPHWLGQARIN